MDTVIQVNNLSHRYNSRMSVDDLSFTVQRGEVLGLLGPNGAGKTTTVRLLNGLFRPASGQMRVLGLDPLIQSDQVRRQTGVLTETPALYERLTARQNLNFFGALAEMPNDRLQERIAGLLAFFELEGRANERVAVFSKGMKQRLALARALLHQPAVLFLDEPTSGLDPEASQQVHELIAGLQKDDGQTVILCTHNLHEAQRLCHRLLIINQGRLLALGSLDELRRMVLPGLWVEIEFWQPPGGELLKSLGGRQGILQARASDAGRWQVQVAEQAVIPQIITHLAAQGAQICAVQPHQVSLEDIYFKLQNQQQAGEA